MIDKLFSKEELERFLNTSKMTKYLNDNRLNEDSRTFNPEMKTIASAKLHSLKHGISTCENTVYVNGMELIKYID